MLRQPQHQPNLVEIQIFLIAFCNSGLLDKINVEDVKLIRSFIIIILNILYTTPLLYILVYSLRYLNEVQLTSTAIALLKFYFTKVNKIK